MMWGLALAVVMAAGLTWVVFVERSRLVIDSQNVTVRNRVRSDFSLRMLHISDLHMNGSSPFRRWRLSRYTQRIKALSYDIVIYTGDMVDDGEGIAPAMAFLADVASGRPVFVVLGNHDYHRYSSLENILNVHTLRDLGLVVDIPPNRYLSELKEAVRRDGMVLLNNRGQSVKMGNAEAWMVGVDDLMLGTPDLNEALLNAPPGAPVVLLSHNPDIYPWADLAGVDLVLSGHTHGGQVCLPWIGPVLTRCRVGRRNASGLSRPGTSLLHVSRGLGETLPIRFHCPHQATIIVLRGEEEKPVR